jgi:hypothetical protein
MKNEFVPYDRALKLKQLGFNKPCLANLIGFSDGTKENGRYKINHQQVFYPNDYTSFDDKSEELGLTPLGICGVPLFQQAFRWFREEYNQHSFIELVFEDEIRFDYVVYVNEDEDDCIDYGDGPFETYEDAELACLDKLIEIVEGIESKK